MPNNLRSNSDLALNTSNFPGYDPENETDTTPANYVANSYSGPRSVAEILLMGKNTSRLPLQYRIITLFKDGVALISIERDGKRVINIYDGENTQEYEPYVKCIFGPPIDSYVWPQIGIENELKSAQKRIDAQLKRLKARRNAIFELEIERSTLGYDD